MPDNHSVEVFWLSAEPEALDYLCNSAPAHGVTPGDTLHRASSQTGIRSLNKCLWDYESWSLFLCCTEGLAMLFYIMGLLSGCRSLKVSECKGSARLIKLSIFC